MNAARALESMLATNEQDVLRAEAACFDTLTAHQAGRVVLFGMGGLGRLILQQLLKNGVKPLALSDSNPVLWQTTIEDIPVLPPDELAKQYGDNASVIVSVYHSAFSELTDAAYNKVARTLRAKGCQSVIPFIPVFWKFAADMLPYLRVDRPSQLLAHAAKVQQVFDLLADEASRREFVLRIRRLLTADLDAWEPTEVAEAYFPYQMFEVSQQESFIDCGAYNGDTLAAFLSHTQGKFASIVAFEPDPGNFTALQKYVTALPSSARKRISLHNKGVWKETTQLQFDSGGSMGSSIKEGGNIKVDVVALDEMLAKTEPTYIKMDIEGAELEALRGAERTIRRCSPRLAVCSNHSQSHLWEVPLLIHEMNPWYSLYLRRDFPDDVDLICYAVPD